MTYLHGMRGFPAIGGGLGGLPQISTRLTFSGPVTGQVSSGSSLLLQVPMYLPGDLLVAFMSIGNSALATWTPPSGWMILKQSSSNIGTCLMYKYAAIIEPVNYSFNLISSEFNSYEHGNGVIINLTNHKLDVIGEMTSIASGSTVTAHSIKTTVNGKLLAVFDKNVSGGVTVTPPIEFTAIKEYESISTGTCWGIYIKNTSAGDTGNQIGTFGSSHYPCSGILFSIVGKS